MLYDTGMRYNRDVGLAEFSEITYGTVDKEPKFVHQYVLGEKLGEGSFGKVREALDSNTLRRVAIKIIKKSQLKKVKGGEESIKTEIAIMRRLRHKNVIELIEVIHDDEKGKMYIVLEFAGAGSLQQLIDSHPQKLLPLSQVKSFFRQLIDGLEYIHNQGVIHRDIKPANLMITPDGILKISDFGVAEFLDTFKPTDMLSRSLGSPAFQSPQIASGSEAFSGVKLDVWAAGVTLYLLVTGEYPFKGSNVFNLYENIAKAEYTIPNTVREPLRGLIQGMLKLNEDERFSIGQIKQHEWLKCDEGETVDTDDIIIIGSPLSSSHQSSSMNDARRSIAASVPNSLRSSPTGSRESWGSFSLLPYIAKVVGGGEKDKRTPSSSSMVLDDPSNTVLGSDADTNDFGMVGDVIDNDDLCSVSSAASNNSHGSNNSSISNSNSTTNNKNNNNNNPSLSSSNNSSSSSAKWSSLRKQGSLRANASASTNNLKADEMTDKKNCTIM